MAVAEVEQTHRPGGLGPTATKFARWIAILITATLAASLGVLELLTANGLFGVIAVGRPDPAPEQWGLALLLPVVLVAWPSPTFRSVLPALIGALAEAIAICYLQFSVGRRVSSPDLPSIFGQTAVTLLFTVGVVVLLSRVRIARHKFWSSAGLVGVVLGGLVAALAIRSSPVGIGLWVGFGAIVISFIVSSATRRREIRAEASWRFALVVVGSACLVGIASAYLSWA